MNSNKLNFYSVLSRLPLLQNSYALKIMVIASLGFLIPWFTLLIYLSANSSWSFNDKLILFIIISLSTLVSLIVTLALLYELLYPVTLISIKLHQYIKNKQRFKLPIGFEDSIGQLMTDIQYTIDQLDSLNQSLEQSFIDPLTGIPNRITGEKRLRQDIARAHREGNQMLIVMLDVDGLENINEQFGHHVANVCLAQIIEVVSQNIREGDWLARWSQEKFLMVLWNFNHATPITVLERIQQQSVKTPMGGLLPLSLSIVACEYKGNTDLDTDTALETLLIHIDEALIEVKQAGNGGIVIAE